MAALVINRVDRRDMGDGLMFAAAAFGGFVWAAGLMAGFNGWPPALRQVSTPGVVANKQILVGNKGSRSYHVLVKTLDGQFQEEFPVSASIYDAYEVGQGACILRTEGRLGMWWKDFRPCPLPNAPAP
jgi:hypothetical protein